jgi:hypothetical protein
MKSLKELKGINTSNKANMIVREILKSRKIIKSKKLESLTNYDDGQGRIYDILDDERWYE